MSKLEVTPSKRRRRRRRRRYLTLVYHQNWWFSEFHPSLNANVLFFFCRLFLNLTLVYDQTQGSSVVFFLLCMTKLRVLVLCFSYFTDNSNISNCVCDGLERFQRDCCSEDAVVVYIDNCKHVQKLFWVYSFFQPNGRTDLLQGGGGGWDITTRDKTL
jgi:hypothetical protein